MRLLAQARIEGREKSDFQNGRLEYDRPALCIPGARFGGGRASIMLEKLGIAISVCGVLPPKMSGQDILFALGGAAWPFRV